VVPIVFIGIPLVIVIILAVRHMKNRGSTANTPPTGVKTGAKTGRDLERQTGAQEIDEDVSPTKGKQVELAERSKVEAFEGG
jgi:hypothetical protein